MEINSWTIYSTNYCTEFTGGQCIQWTKIYWIDKSEAKEIGVSILWTSFVFLSILLFLGRILKVLFSKFFWWKK